MSNGKSFNNRKSKRRRKIENGLKTTAKFGVPMALTGGGVYIAADLMDNGQLDGSVLEPAAQQIELPATYETLFLDGHILKAGDGTNRTLDPSNTTILESILEHSPALAAFAASHDLAQYQKSLYIEKNGSASLNLTGENLAEKIHINRSIMQNVLADMLGVDYVKMFPQELRAGYGQAEVGVDHDWLAQLESAAGIDLPDATYKSLSFKIGCANGTMNASMDYTLDDDTPGSVPVSMEGYETGNSQFDKIADFLEDGRMARSELEKQSYRTWYEQFKLNTCEHERNQQIIDTLTTQRDYYQNLYNTLLANNNNLETQYINLAQNYSNIYNQLNNTIMQWQNDTTNHTNDLNALNESLKRVYEIDRYTMAAIYDRLLQDNASEAAMIMSPEERLALFDDQNQEFQNSTLIIPGIYNGSFMNRYNNDSTNDTKQLTRPLAEKIVHLKYNIEGELKDATIRRSRIDKDSFIMIYNDLYNNQTTRKYAEAVMAHDQFVALTDGPINNSEIFDDIYLNITDKDIPANFYLPTQRPDGTMAKRNIPLSKEAAVIWEQKYNGG